MTTRTPPAEHPPQPVTLFARLEEHALRLRAELSAAEAGLGVDRDHRRRGIGHEIGVDRAVAHLKAGVALATTMLDLLSACQTTPEGIGAHCYGQCHQCGRPITTERLHVLPCATLCLRCEEQD